MCICAGVHVTLPDYYSPEHLGMIVPKTKDGRVVFMLPWLDATIAGTTGTTYADTHTVGTLCNTMHISGIRSTGIQSPVHHNVVQWTTNTCIR